MNQFESPLAAFAGQRKVIKEKIVQLEAQITGGEAQVKAYKAQLASVNRNWKASNLQLHQGEQGKRHDAPDIFCDGALAIGIRNDLCRITLLSDRVIDGETVNRLVVGHLSIPAAGMCRTGA